METIRIRYLCEDLPRISAAPGGDWVDLRSAEDIEMKAGEFRLIPLGVAMQLPEGYEAHIAPRSSTFKNFGLLQTNSVGVVDGSYCGDGDEWKAPMLATRDVTVHKGDRICQFRIVRNQPQLIFEEAEHLEGTDRGGFGSTGIQ